MPSIYETPDIAGVPNIQVNFTKEIREATTGKFIDDDNWTALSELPRVRILNPDGGVVYDTDVGGQANPPIAVGSRGGVGKYAFLFKIPLASEVTINNPSRVYKIEWNFKISGVDSIVTDDFNVSDKIKYTYTTQDQRVGFMFGNPDVTSNHYYNGWGRLVTPDEIRDGLFFGNEMAAQNGDWFTPSIIQWYIDNSLSLLEEDLNIAIAPKNIRHRPFPPFTTNNQPGTRTDFDPLTEDFEWEDPYDYKSVEFAKYVYIKLRINPLIQLLKVEMIDPLGARIIDLLQHARPNYEVGSLQFYPNQVLIGTFPLLTVATSKPYHVYPDSLNNFPDAFLIDYIAGYENARKVPKELRQVLFNLTALNILSDIGDGRSAALASSSISLAGVSESSSTTQSATSALYGARLESIRKWLKEFYHRSRTRYSGIIIGGV